MKKTKVFSTNAKQHYLRRRVLKQYLFIIIILILASSLVPSIVVFSACPICDPSIEICNPLKFCNMQTLLLAILDAVIQILFPIVVLSLVYTGFLFIRAQGRPPELERARAAFFWSLVGGVAVLGAKGFALAIEATVAGLSP